MIVLDTNVVSELMKAEADTMVLAWTDAQPGDDLWVTAVTAAELFFAVARLPDGRRRQELAARVVRMLDVVLGGRCASLTSASAPHYGAISAQRQRAGRSLAVPDLQIAAICRSHGATLATRNTKDFADTGVELVNPWDRP